MNYKLARISPVAIGILLSLLYVSPIIGQDQKAAINNDEIEVRKVVDAFHKNFERTLSFDLVPKELFARNFKASFSKPWPWNSSEALKNAGSSVHYIINENFVNLFYLALISAKADRFRPDDSDETDFEVISIFPEKIAAKIKEMRLLGSILGNDNKELSNERDVIKFVDELKVVITLFQEYLSVRGNPWSDAFRKKVEQSRKKDSWYETRICESECGDLPANTRIFTITSLPLFFTLIKENGKFRILDIKMMTN